MTFALKSTNTRASSCLGAWNSAEDLHAIVDEEWQLRLAESPLLATSVGVDDHDMSHLFDLTTVAQDTRRAGRLLVETLINLIEGRPVRSAKLPTRLVVRESSIARP